MPDIVDEGWMIFIEQYPQFMKLQRKLASLEWYRDGNWVTFIGHFYAGIFLQMYKAHWFNYSLDGIHFETGMSRESVERKVLRIDLHIGHRNLFDRAKFNELTLPRLEQAMAEWQGASRFSKTNLSERLSVDVPISQAGFANQVAQAFARLASLAPIIDDGLARL